MSRLLEALRHLQQPGQASSAEPRKATLRLAASIRKAVLGREPVADAPVLFRVPDAETATKTPPPTSPDPVKLVEKIEASIQAVQDESTASSATANSPPKASEPIPAPQRLPATPGELELLAMLTIGPHAATFRDLLAAVQRDTAAKQRPVVAIVGLDEQDSTGLVAGAVAMLLQDQGSTLLIEANPHDRDVAVRFGVSEDIGLCEALSGRGDCNIAQTSREGLDVLAFGRATSSQAQLLPQVLPALVSQLRSRYGRTVIDAGPLNGAWAGAASRAADAVYLLVRLGDTSAERAVECVKRFRAAGGKLTGCVALGAA